QDKKMLVIAIDVGREASAGRDCQAALDTKRAGKAADGCFPASANGKCLQKNRALGIGSAHPRSILRIPQSEMPERTVVEGHVGRFAVTFEAPRRLGIDGR